MSRPKHTCIHNGKEYEVADLAKIANVSHDTMRGRLTRTAKQEVINGKLVYVCTDYHLRPAIKVGRKTERKQEDTPFSISRYSPSADGDKSIMKIAAKSQMWLSKKILTEEEKR